MKTEKAANAALRKALNAMTRMRASLRIIEMQERHAGKSIIAREMPLIRKDLAELNQRVHEFNAYNNASKHV